MPELYQNAAAAGRPIALTDIMVGFNPLDGTDQAVATDTLGELIARIFANPPAGLTDEAQAAFRAAIGVDEGFAELIAEALTGNTETGADLSFAGGKLNIVVGGVAPQQEELVYYGVIASAASAANVDVATLSSADATVAGHDISIGPSTDGAFFVILAPAIHAILTLVNTGLGVDVLNTYTRADDVRMLGNPAENYHAYTIGPLNPGLTVNYRLTLTE